MCCRYLRGTKICRLMARWARRGGLLTCVVVVLEDNCRSEQAACLQLLCNKQKIFCVPQVLTEDEELCNPEERTCGVCHPLAFKA